ncbi:MAG TPA: NirD/YgiW/YdeI family stress tolerance protein [Oceanipulchritudo sp.]|nr:NirD/YgiW/YdeI family stress tolerance protein [Oceanipulchritudo sp.]
MAKIKLILLIGGAVLLLAGNKAIAGAAGERGEPEAVSAALVAGAVDMPVTPISKVRRGQEVTLLGRVDRIRDEDEFTLRDDTGKIKIYIGWKNEMPVSVGETVTVAGRADDDAFPGMRPEIYARAIILSNGDRINLRTGQTERASN